MPLPGISEENELKPLLKKLLNDKDEVYKFAVAASGPKDGQLILDKKQKLKKKEVQVEAEAEAKKKGGKGGKLDVMTGECRQDATNATTLRLIVYGKAPAKAVACMEHLLVRGPFKTIGFTAVILEEVDEENAEAPAAPTAGGETAPAAPPDEQVNWEKALAAIEPDYLRGVRDRPDAANKLRAVMGFAQGKAEVKDYKAAIAALKKLSELLGAMPATPTSDSKPIDTPAADADPAAAFTARLKALMPRIKQAAETSVGADVKLQSVEAGQLAQKKQFDDAHQMLDRVESLLNAAPGEATSAQPDANEKEWEKMNADWRRVRDGRELVTALMEADDRMGNRLSDLCERGDQACEARQDLAAAQEALKQLQAMILASQRPDATPEEDPGEWDEVAAQWQKMQSSANLIWAVEKTQYANQISDLIERGDAALAARTDLWTMRDVMARLENCLRQAVDDAGGIAEWRRYVMDAIKDLRKLQASIRRTGLRGAAEVADRFNEVIARLRIEPQSRHDVQELETFIRDNDTITRAEKKNPLGVDVQVREPLLAALQRVSSSLPA